MSETKTEKGEKNEKLDFEGLEFEEVLSDLLKIKPVDNLELKKPKPTQKKKSKPTK